MSKTRWATAAGFGAILLWSGSVALTRSVSEKLGPLATGALVFALAGVLTLAHSFVRSPRETMGVFRSMSLRNGLVCGGLFLLYTLSYNLAIGWAANREQTLEVALLNYLWPALTILFSLFALPIRSTWGVFPGVGIAVGGVFLVMTTGSTVSWRSFLDHVASNPLAFGAALSAGVTWALYSVLTRRWSQAEGGTVSLFLLASGLALGVPAAFLSKGVTLSRAGIAEAAVLGLVTAIAYGLWDYAIRQGDIVKVAVASYFTPVLATLFSCAYLAVAPDPRIWMGSAVIAAGSLLCWRSVREETGVTSPVPGIPPPPPSSATDS